MLISTTNTLPPDSALREQFEPPRGYIHRWWFREQGYKTSSFGSLFEGLRSGELLGDWASFVADRTEEESLGTLRGEVWFPLPESERPE